MSNHIADANKMVSDTPRTDSLLTAILDLDGYVAHRNCPPPWVSHARELERELNAANERIKRLEEAVDAYRTAYTPDGHVAPHDCFATGPKTGNPWQDYLTCPGCWAELKAKEAKP